MIKALACRVEGPSSNLTMERLGKKRILCLHDGTSDDRSAPQLIKKAWACAIIFMQFLGNIRFTPPSYFTLHYPHLESPRSATHAAILYVQI